MAGLRANSFLCLSILAATIGLSGCEKIKSLIEKDTGCGDAIALSAVDSQFEKGVLAATKSYIRNTNANVNADMNTNTLRNIINGLKTTVEDIRTQSDKKTCTGTLNLAINNETLAHANAVREARGDKPIQDVILGQDFNLDGTTLSQDIEYQLQPTDDGKKVIATLKNVSQLQKFLAQLAVDASQPIPQKTEPVASIVASTLVVESAPTTQASEPTPARKDSEPPSDAANDTHSSTSQDVAESTTDEAVNQAVTQAQARLDAKRQQFNDMWKAASPEAQESLTEDQKQWVEERDATCQGEAEQAKTGYEEATRLTCMSRMLSERYSEVKEYFSNYE